MSECEHVKDCNECYDKISNAMADAALAVAKGEVMEPSDLTGLPDHALKQMIAALREENARLKDDLHIKTAEWTTMMEENALLQVFTERAVVSGVHYASSAEKLNDKNRTLRQRVEELERDIVRMVQKGAANLERAEAAEAKLARCVEAASDVAEGACSFKDSRVSYEEWQINVGSMERLRAAIAGEATARGWLIESTLSHGGGPRWWQGKQPGTEEQWTGSHTAAIRFARREDAEACRLTLGDAHVSKVTEHVWL